MVRLQPHSRLCARFGWTPRHIVAPRIRPKNVRLIMSKTHPGPRGGEEDLLMARRCARGLLGPSGKRQINWNVGWRLLADGLCRKSTTMGLSPTEALEAGHASAWSYLRLAERGVAVRGFPW